MNEKDALHIKIEAMMQKGRQEEAESDVEIAAETLTESGKNLNEA